MYKTLVKLVVLVIAVSACVSCNSPSVPHSRSDTLIQTAKTLVTTLAKADYPAAEKDFSEELKGKLPPQKLKEIWEAVIGQSGAFREQLEPQTAKSLEQNVVYDIVIIPCRFERSTLNLRLAFNAQNQISGMFFTSPT